MKKVQILLGTAIPGPDGQMVNGLGYTGVKDVVLRDGMLMLSLEDGKEIGFNAGLIITYSVDPFGSIATVPPGSQILKP